MRRRPTSRPSPDAGSEPEAASRSGAGAAEDPTEEDGRVGIFPSWRSLYLAVTLYTAALVAILYLLTRLLDFSTG